MLFWLSIPIASVKASGGTTGQSGSRLVHVMSAGDMSFAFSTHVTSRKQWIRLSSTVGHCLCM